VITTDTGGIGEAVGDTALIVPADSPSSITAALDLAVTMPLPERADMAGRARAHALQFDRMNVFDQLLERVDKVVTPGSAGAPASSPRLALR
jgi:glycosyltransferase involved in cell wall biosynthesis